MKNESVGERTISRRDALRSMGILGSAVIGAPFLQACQSPTTTVSSPAGAKPTGSVIVVNDQAIDTLDPHLSTRAFARSLNLTMFETLAFHDPADVKKIVPKLATSWEVGADQVTWTFKLRENVKFHDGTPFNADAVKYSFARLIDPATGAADFGRLGSIARVDVVNAQTVNIVTKAPFPELLLSLASLLSVIVSPTAASKGKVADFGRAPVGTGPFRFKEFRGVDAAVVEANPDYWGIQPKVASITFRSVPDKGAIIAGVEAGEFDIALDIPPDEVKRLRASSRVAVETFDVAGADMVGMLNTKKPFSDIRVRKALNVAVDRDAIAQNIFGGLAQPMTSPLFAGLQYRVAQQGFRYDPQQAKQLLTDAGYGSGLKVTLLYAPLGVVGSVVQAMAADYRKVGVELDLQSRESVVWSQLVRAKDDARDMFYNEKSGLGTDFNMTRLYTKGSWDIDNRSRYFNSRVEDLLTRARSSFDEKVRADAYAEAQKLIWDDVPEVFLLSKQLAVAASKKVTGFSVLPDRNMLLSDVVIKS